MTAAPLDQLVAHRLTITQLAVAEMRWLLHHRLLWLGAGATAAIAILYIRAYDEGYGQSASYIGAPMSVLPWAIVAFVVASRAGARDDPAGHPPFSPVTPLGQPDRMLGRAFGLALPVGVAAMLAIAVGVISRIEGGYWIGDAPFRTDTAQHPWIELAQIPLITFVLGGAGLALGRLVPRRALGIVTTIATVVLVLGLMGWWIWNSELPLHSAALHQTQPMRVDVPSSLARSDFPADWLMESPGQYEPRWGRMIVHHPTIFAHNFYLAALGIALCAIAMWTRTSRRVALGAAFVAASAVAAQVAIYPTIS